MHYVHERTDAIVRADANVVHPGTVDHLAVLQIGHKLAVIRAVAQHATTGAEVHMRRRVSESRVSCQMCFEVAQR